MEWKIHELPHCSQKRCHLRQSLFLLDQRIGCLYENIALSGPTDGLLGNNFIRYCLCTAILNLVLSLIASEILALSLLTTWPRSDRYSDPWILTVIASLHLGLDLGGKPTISCDQRNNVEEITSWHLSKNIRYWIEEKQKWSMSLADGFIYED